MGKGKRRADRAQRRQSDDEVPEMIELQDKDPRHGPAPRPEIEELKFVAVEANGMGASLLVGCRERQHRFGLRRGDRRQRPE